MADLPSILGGLAQGFVDFGKGAVDLFGTGGAAIGDLIHGTGTKNQDDFRKWLYNTNDNKDAAAKGLGTALNGVQTALDYIPGVNMLTRNPLGNAAQGALGGLADELKTYGADYDLERAGKRAAISGAAAAASGSLADALKGSSNALLSSNAAQGLARGATSGAISGGGYAAIDGGDVAQGALQGAGMGALIGGVTGAVRDFKPAKTYDVALTDSEKQARAANIDDQLARIDTSTPEGKARYNELTAARDNYADVAVNNPRYLADENGDPRTFYHGSPNKNITEFDINQAGKNTRSGERALYFTDSPEVADEFSYERIPTDDLFLENRGEKGRVYPVNLEMNNPLDLDNLTDAQIRELWDYASPMGQLDGQEKFIKNLTNWRDNTHNAQLTKGYLDLDKLANSQYDGFTARMYPNQENQAREYAVFDNSKVKMLEDVLANDDMAINNAIEPPSGIVIAGKNRDWDELYNMFGKDAGAFENEDRTPITATPQQLRNEIQAIDAKYPDDLPDDVYDKRFALNQQLKAAEKGYSSPYDYYVGESKKRFRQDFENYPDRYAKKIADMEKQAQAKIALEQDIAEASPRKLAQFNIIQQKNPAPNDTLTWIRSPKDIMTWDEAITASKTSTDPAFTWPDYTLEDALRDQKRGKMTVYSSYPIKGGEFVTPSRQQASDYAGGGRIYSKVIRPNDVAWINGDEGQYAYTKVKSLEKSLSANDRAINDVDIMGSKIAPGQLGLFDDMPTQTPKTGTRQTSIFDQPDDPYLDYYGADIAATPLAPESPAISGPVDMSVEDLTKIAIDESTLPKGWKKAQELANMGKRAKQIVLDPNDPNRAQNEYNVALYSDAQYGRNMPVADVIDRLGQIQYGREVDRGAARILADQLDESGDEFAKKFVSGAAEAGGNISHYRDAPKAKLADEQLSRLLNIGRSSSMLSDSLANPSARNVRGDQWKGTINLDGKSIAKGSDGGISTFGHERLHAFQDAGSMGYDQRVVDAYNELHDDLSKIYHSDSQILKDYGGDVKYWGKPIEQEARMAQFYLEDKFGVKGAHKVPERDANGKAIRYKDDGTIADPNNLRDYYTGKPAYKGEFEGDREAINAAFDKFRSKLQDLTRKGVALPAIAALFGGGAYMASKENDKEREVK